MSIPWSALVLLVVLDVGQLDVGAGAERSGHTIPDRSPGTRQPGVREGMSGTHHGPRRGVTCGGEW
ncbi:hypothetical protein ABZ691_33090 [Streptomyces sp. NPDC006854]|uniref:hypothetical protein n=1 Tax=Streptomyces sp. NPDC006854 TaxID=3155115 RepID=UPI00340E35B0